MIAIDVRNRKGTFINRFEFRSTSVVVDHDDRSKGVRVLNDLVLLTKILLRLLANVVDTIRDDGINQIDE